MSLGARANQTLFQELAPDGKRFLMMKPLEEELSTDLVVVLDLFDELERLAPSK